MNDTELLAEAKAKLKQHLALLKSQIEVDSLFYRVQETRHSAPYRFNKHSPTRFGGQLHGVGVTYVGFGEVVSVAERFQVQGGPGSTVLLEEIEACSIIRLKAARPLSVIDGTTLSRLMGYRPEDIVRPRGEDDEGYRLPQAISAACASDLSIDGIVYRSSVYDSALSGEGRNMVLFEREDVQLIAISSRPIMQVVLQNGQGAVEMLMSIGIDVE